MEMELFPSDPLNPSSGWTIRFGTPEAWLLDRAITEAQAMEIRNLVREYLRGIA